MQSETIKLLEVIAVGTILTLLVAAFMVSFVIKHRKKRNEFIREKLKMETEFEKQLLQSRIEMQEYTYSALSKELHDNVGQLLSTSRMLLGLTERTLPNPPDTLLTANATLGEAISELRSLSKSLDKEWLEQFSFTDNLQTEISRINAGNGVLAEFISSDHLPLASGEQIILFRIVQEAIQNAIKHGHPKNMRVEIKQEENNFCITISDDGTGFTNNEKAAGMGMTNMKHRTNLLGGTISWNSIPEQGTTVYIFLPNKKETL
jgi:signal transduction histidine kinase